MIRHLCAAAVTIAALAGSAAAATYSLGGSGGNLGPTEVFSAAGGPNVTVTSGATGIVNFCGSSITQSAGGLGVDGCPDTEPGQVDGNPVTSSETLTFEFDWAVNLLGFGLSDVDGNDQYDISINGGAFANGLTALVNNGVNVNYVTKFVIRASGTFLFDFDNFKVASIQTASVPLPAAGWLLLAGIGGMAALRRKRAAA